MPKTPGSWFGGNVNSGGGASTPARAAITGELQMPDLVVNGLATTPATLSASGPVTVSFNIANTGVFVARGSVAKVYLSTDATITASDTLLGQISVAQLAAGATIGKQATYTLPSGLTGTYYIGVIADANSQVQELNETNNTSAVQLTIGPPPAADLQVSGLSGPASVFAGEQATFTYDINNAGTLGAGASSTAIYLSSDATITSADLLLTTDAVPLLGVGASGARTVTVTLPGSVAPGTYYIGVAADSTNAVAESNEANNTTAKSIVVPAPLFTDLQVSGLAGPASVLAGEQATFTYDINNSGTGGAGATTSAIYLSTDSTITSSDLLLTTDAVPLLGAGASGARSVTFTLPGSLTPGTYYIGVAADSTNAVAESNEANNTTAKAIVVPVPPIADLQVSGPSGLPASLLAGGQATFSYTIDNTGTAAAGASTTAIYLSSDATITSGDLLLTTDAVPLIGAGVLGSVRTVTFTLPGNVTPGTYYIGVAADSTNAVAESNEANNTGAASLLVPVPPIADLRVSGLSGVPASLAAGGQATISYTIDNLGTAAAAASTTAIYLSSDATITSGDVLLTTDLVPSIGAGVSGTVRTVTLTLPGNLAPGTYYIGVAADSTGAVSESDETNNTVAASVLVPQFTPNDDNVTLTVPATNAHALAGNDTVVGTASADTIHGDEGNDTLAGVGGNDTLYGDDNNDALFGGPGQDNLYGGTGDDLLYVLENDGVLDGGDGYDQVIVLDANGVSIVLGPGVEYAAGGNGNDSISALGLTMPVTIGGAGGNDTLTGGSAADTLAGGEGNDTLAGGGGNDLMFGGPGMDNFSGGDGDDVLYILTGDGTIEGGAGYDQAVVLDTAGVSIVLGSGIEYVAGNNGNDTLDARGVATAVTMGGAGGNDTLYGTALDDVLGGAGGGDTLYGLTGNDTLFGGDGNDFLWGGIGNDQMTMGTGVDVVFIENNPGNDFVLGFENGIDHIDMTHFSGVHSFADLVVMSSRTTPDSIITFGGFQLTIVGVSGVIDASDFVFA